MFKIGIVGAGIMGTQQAQMLSSKLLSSRAKLIGVCDTSFKRARALAKTHQVPAYEDLERFLQTEKPDAIYIAVPDDVHREPVLTAAKHKVHLLVEKPLATTTVDAQAITRAIKAAGIVAEVNFSNRWNPPYMAAYNSIKAGKIGEVVTINARLSNRIWVPTKMLSWAGSTTAGWFLLSHTIDLATWLSGKKAVSVYANGVKKKLLAMGIPTWPWAYPPMTISTPSCAMKMEPMPCLRRSGCCPKVPPPSLTSNTRLSARMEPSISTPRTRPFMLPARSAWNTP